MGCCHSRTGAHQVPVGLEPGQVPSYVPPICEGRVIKVYDGDTITVATPVPGSDDRTVYKFSVRLAGIDCPELRSESNDERFMARNAQRATSGQLLGKVVALRNVRTEKYGRLLCDVWVGDRHINQWLINEGHAVAYEGGKRKQWISAAV